MTFDNIVKAFLVFVLDDRSFDRPDKPIDEARVQHLKFGNQPLKDDIRSGSASARTLTRHLRLSVVCCAASTGEHRRSLVKLAGGVAHVLGCA
ncbi:hypothetical protein [Caulobacter sp. SSI4214]|uniref:hypothetical protein n=1 Tax=Caulobacter sp. SSI4214 TaxID=2575739 RepID=UPI00143CA2EC|nr:hypothetical protein [Caulobacter sp. SSI4214]